MRTAVTLVALLILGFTGWCMFPEQGFDRTAFYSAMELDNLNNVNVQLKLMEKATIKEKQAFSGALLMKKAGLIGGPAKKLKMFKEGHKLLEDALSKDSSNVEYRFLRLMIQENAPKMLTYNKELDKDSEYITKHFASLPQAARNAVNSYSKRSKVIKPVQL